MEVQPREIQNYLKKELKVPTSRSYHEYLISSRKTPESVAGYIEVMLEFESEDPEPELLRAGFKDVMLFNLES